MLQGSPPGQKLDSGFLGRADELDGLLSEVLKLVRSFIGAADLDARSLVEGHGSSVPGSTHRTVLVEHHPAPKLASLLNLTVSPSQSGAAALIAAASDVLRYSVNTSSPGFLDKLYSSPSPPGIAADLLLSALNTNVHVYACSPALTLVEKHVGKELARMFGLDSAQSGGVNVPGGASANTTAMLIARNVRFPSVKEDGLAALPKRLACFTSNASHYSISTAAQTLGIGSRSIYKVPVRNEAMDITALETMIGQSIKDGAIPFFISATSGTTVRGAYDDLAAIGQLAQKYHVWFHVDACWGGGAVFSPELCSKLAGSHLADSISFNPHKMLGVPVTTSFLLGRDLRTFWAANRLEAGYLFHEDAENAQLDAVESDADASLQTKSQSDVENWDWKNSPWVMAAPHVDNVFDLAQFVPACGRRPDALKMYLHWRYYGTEGIAKHVEASFAGAQTVIKLVQDSAVLSVVGDGQPPCAQACFYYSGQGGRLKMNKEVTRLMVAKLVDRGWMTDYSPGDNKDEEYLRVVCNRLTSDAIAAGLVKAVTEVGAEVERELGL